MIHVLHIVGSYGGTEVYKNLFTNLDRLGVRQTVFVPLNVANHNRVGNHLINFNVPQSKIIYSVDLKYYHRFFYQAKIQKIVRVIEEKVDLKEVDIIHAATLCVDGAVAHALKKKYHIPYLSAIRNTDIAIYYKYLKWQRNYFFEIFKEAASVIFICPQYMKSYMKKYCSSLNLEKESDKVKVIPNGVHNIFLQDRSLLHRKLSTPIKVVFASAFTKSKGLKEVIEAISLLRDTKHIDIKLEAIGKGLPFRKENNTYVKQIEQIAQRCKWITLLNYVPKEQLKEIFRNGDIYVMPSKPETFGLVYVEALSQGMPLVYGKGQGFDGYFEDGYVGYAAEPFNVKDIAEKIELVILRYETVVSQINSLDLSDLFSWESISTKYFNLYNKILGL